MVMEIVGLFGDPLFDNLFLFRDVLPEMREQHYQPLAVRIPLSYFVLHEKHIDNQPSRRIEA
jgi:hypothetical protein